MILSVMEKLAPFSRHAMNRVTVEETETGSTRILSSSLVYKKEIWKRDWTIEWDN